MSDWVTVQPSLDPILAPVNAVLAGIDAVLSALIAILNIVQTILNIIKAFLLGLLDPLTAIIKAIIAEIRAIINDLKQMGFYVHIGDIRLVQFSNNFQDIRGGFQAFERRCIARLVDKRDLSRPNFSSSSAALAGFFYVSGQDVDAIIRVIITIAGFFGKKPKTQAAFPQPTGLSVVYGNEPFSSFKELGAALSGGEPPNKAILKWKMPAGPGGGAGFKIPAPKGWIIEVSTVESGLKVVGTVPADMGSNSIFPPIISAVGIDPVTNGVLEVYGGADMVGSESEDYSDVWPTDPSDPRAVKLWFQKDINTPLIPPKALSKDNGGPWLGAAFFVPNKGIALAMPGQEFNAVFEASMLPKDADIEQDTSDAYGIKFTERTASSYFFRVRAVAESVLDAVEDGSPHNPQPMSEESLRLYKFTSDNIRQAKSGRLFPTPPNAPDLNVGDWGIASQAVEAAFPSESSQSYVQAIQLALIVMLLSRSDASAPSKPGKFSSGTVLGTTGLEEVSQKLFKQMKVNQKWFNQEDPTKWAKTTYAKSLATANTLYSMASLSETIMAAVVEIAQPLFTATWKSCAVSWNPLKGGTSSPGPAITIAQTFGIGAVEYEGKTPKEVRNDPLLGCAPNWKSVPVQDTRGKLGYFNVVGGPARSPGFGVQPGTASDKWTPGNGSLDYSPVVYTLSDDATQVTYVAFVRNLLLANPDLVSSAAGVLKVTAAIRSPKDGGWEVYRPLYEMLAPLDQVLTKVEDWLLALLSALDGVIERIIAYIEAIQARIYQLQALIEWIRSLIKSLDFALPSASGLVVVANGTDGILMDLISAGNKPADDPQSMGCGLIVVAGGVPMLLLDLFAAIMGGSAPVDA